MVRIGVLLKQFLEELAKEFPVKVCSPYHVQIIVDGSKKKHNIYFTKAGDIKFQGQGQREVEEFHSTAKLKERLRTYDYSKTDLAAMEALKFLESIKETNIKEGIFVDAGFRQDVKTKTHSEQVHPTVTNSAGWAKIAIVRIKGDDVDIFIRKIDPCENVMQAEDLAIKMAIALFPGDEPIYNDCQPAVDLNTPRARWIDRKFNKEADRLCNLRGAKGKRENQ